MYLLLKIWKILDFLLFEICSTHHQPIHLSTYFNFIFSQKNNEIKLCLIGQINKLQ